MNSPFFLDFLVFIYYTVGRKGVFPMSSYLTFQVAEGEVAYPPRVHYHPDYEVYYLTDGVCRYFIHNKTYRLTAGDIVVIPPGLIHKVIYESPSHSRMLFNCTADFVPASVRKVEDRITYFPQTPETAKQITSLYRKIREASAKPDEFWEDSLRCHISQLFLLMAKSSCHPASRSAGSPFVENAVEYIRANYMYRLTLPETARHCAVSPEHLSRVFKRETGFGFNEYLNLYRLKKAESILKSGKAGSIAQVASLCGFSDSNYFSNTYKKMFGISPSQAKIHSEQEADDV